MTKIGFFAAIGLVVGTVSAISLEFGVIWGAVGGGLGGAVLAYGVDRIR